MIKTQTLKGFRDFLPKESKRRQYIIDSLKEVFTSYGFEPIETPSLEYEEVLTGKYGDEGEKLMYKFTDNGERKVALRYDQTVPLARFVAQNQNDLEFPFKRYQIQNVWRSENTQKGRYREFLQVDADIVGSSSFASDIEIVSLVSDCLKKLGFKDFKILVNERSTFSKLTVSDEKLMEVIRALDKIKKIGREGVVKELVVKGFTSNEAELIIKEIEEIKPSEQILQLIENVENVEFLPALARGLDYYTGLIFEVEVEGYPVGSVVGGGRYDNLIGIFSGKSIPAVGFAFGFDRLFEALEVLNLFPKDLSQTKVLVTNSLQSVEIVRKLRERNINSELYVDNKDLEKQLKYADKKNIPFVLIVEDEKLILKDMVKREQSEKSLEEVMEVLSN